MFWSVVTTSGRPVEPLQFFLASHTEPYFSKHSTTRLICRSEGKFRPWNLASRPLNALLTVVTELVSYHFFTTKIMSSRSRIIENDQKRTKWVTNRNYLEWSKFTFRHRNVTQTVFVFRTTIIGYIIGDFVAVCWRFSSLQFVILNGHFLQTTISSWMLRGPGGGLHRNSLEIDFIVVSDRGEWYLSAAFGPMEKFCS